MSLDSIHRDVLDMLTQIATASPAKANLAVCCFLSRCRIRHRLNRAYKLEPRWGPSLSVDLWGLPGHPHCVPTTHALRWEGCGGMGGVRSAVEATG
jgi:hypothetical protein